MEIKAKYPVSTPAYANEIADKYLAIVRGTNKAAELSEPDSRKEILKQEFVRGEYASQFKTQDGSMKCELIFSYSNKDPSSVKYGSTLSGDVYFYPIITCNSSALDFWYERVL